MQIVKARAIIRERSKIEVDHQIKVNHMIKESKLMKDPLKIENIARSAFDKHNQENQNVLPSLKPEEGT